MRIALYGRGFNPDYDVLMKEILHVLHNAGAELVVFNGLLNDIKRSAGSNADFKVFNSYE